jgi:hypothetical protein
MKKLTLVVLAFLLWAVPARAQFGGCYGGGYQQQFSMPYQMPMQFGGCYGSSFGGFQSFPYMPPASFNFGFQPSFGFRSFEFEPMFAPRFYGPPRPFFRPFFFRPFAFGGGERFVERSVIRTRSFGW